MEKYIVSARKYRPMTWGSVVGQEALTTTLRNAITSGRSAHAYLFCGPRGVGKTTCARIFARSINCLTPTAEGDACGVCESCKAFEEGRSYNIYELDAASNNSVEDIRLLNEQVRMQPQIGRYKVFIIDEVHMLSIAAFNAFLKTLEEPPAHAVFILATTEKHKILPTILSRCQIYDFNRMEIEGIVGHLKRVAENEGYTYEEEALGVIARKADGGMRDALSIFDQVAGYAEGNITYKKVIEDLNILDYDYYFRLMDQILEKKVPEVMVTLGEILSKGFEGGHFISGFASHLRDLLMCRDERTLPLMEVAESVKERYAAQAKRCDAKFLYRALKLCNDCDLNYRAASNKRLLVELTMIQVAQALDEDDAGCGRRPKKILKPLFAAIKKVVTEVAKPQVAAAVAAVRTAASNEQMASATTVPASVSATPARNLQTAPKRQTPRSLSIKLKNNVSAQKAENNIVEAPVVKEVQEVRPFEFSELSFWWYRYAMQLPAEENAVAGRLKNIRPILMDGWRVEAPVENEQVLIYMNEHLPYLQNFLRENLRNKEINLHFRMMKEVETKRRAYTKREQLALMLEKSEALRSLRNALKLELT
ncbi:MAG: DNA polymerase III subunit gamma/tau [Bacteroidaceae bacterium]|nr:DNA polymerase III subunit gamma/tau [Bacteroidaceae bacterium]